MARCRAWLSGNEVSVEHGEACHCPLEPIHLDNTILIVMVGIANRTGERGRRGWADGLGETMRAVTKKQIVVIIDWLIAQRYVTQTPGTPYLCITIAGVKRLIHEKLV